MEYVPNKFERDQCFKKFIFSIQKKLSEKIQLNNTEERQQEGAFLIFLRKKFILPIFLLFFFNSI